MNEKPRSLFVEALFALRMLKEVVYTHNHLVEDTLRLCLPALRLMPHLQVLDLYRNSLSNELMQELSETLPHVSLLGAAQQSHF